MSDKKHHANQVEYPHEDAGHIQELIDGKSIENCLKNKKFYI